MSLAFVINQKRLAVAKISDMLLSLEAKCVPHSDGCGTCRDTLGMRT